jgi:aspartate aminotransferase
MTAALPSQKTAHLAAAFSPFLRFFQDSAYPRLVNRPETCNFAIGNPHEMPLEGFVDALQKAIIPQTTDWFAYKMNEPGSTKAIVAELKAWRGIEYDRHDIFVTNGGFAAIAVTLRTILNPGDEVVFITPPWFFYEALIVDAGGAPVRVPVRADNFDLDIDGIAAAITPQTRAVLVNSPHNPTGKIYPPETLEKLAGLLTQKSAEFGRTIYLLSDEAYSRIVFDDHRYPSPTEFYPNSFLMYTYGKVLLTPGQRVGFIALPPQMPDREVLRDAIFLTQVTTGYAFANSLLQHAMADLTSLSIDIPHLQQKRDRMVNALREMGYQVHAPEGTFYLLPKSPIEDDWAFCERLAEYNILCLPGTVVELPGYFRVSLTANDAMIDRGLPGFRAALER